MDNEISSDADVLLDIRNHYRSTSQENLSDDEIA